MSGLGLAGVSIELAAHSQDYIIRSFVGQRRGQELSLAEATLRTDCLTLLDVVELQIAVVVSHFDRRSRGSVSAFRNR